MCVQVKVVTKHRNGGNLIRRKEQKMGEVEILED